MKASNIILISLIGSITLIILTAMAEIRLKSTPRESYAGFSNKQIELPAFQCLVIYDMNFVEVQSSPQAAIELTWEKDTPAPDVRYHLEGDTLYIDSIEPAEGFGSAIKVLAPAGQIGWIGGRHSRITLRNLNAAHLVLHLDAANVSIESNEPAGIKSLHVSCINNSFISTGSSVMLDTLDLHLENSRATVHAPVQKLRGAMANDSELSIKRVIDFEFKQDDSSRLHYWN